MKKQKTLRDLRTEILQTEQAFMEMAGNKGIAVAFLHFAAPQAVLFRQNQLFEGKLAIAEFFEQNPFPDGAELRWLPDFVEVSAAGDLAYTYGKYVYSKPDENAAKRESEGIFHTIWKRQPDGEWRFVWD